jgi:WD40 repeat protein
VFGLAKQPFQQEWQGRLTDYVTAIAWSPSGQFLAAASAAGEVVLFEVRLQKLLYLQEQTGYSVDCLAFSHDSQFLAVAGQSGQVKIWQLQFELPHLITTLENHSTWIDRLVWNPTNYQLAFQLGFYVQIWDAQLAKVVETLSLDATVQDLQWQPNGQRLAIAVKDRLRLWQTQTWEEQPGWETMSPSAAIAWSPDGNYIAAGNLDRSLLVWQWGTQYPWRMEGFPAKVSHLAWSDRSTPSGAPLLVASSADGMVRWEKDRDQDVGWNGEILDQHHQKIEAIAFQPHSFLLASAGLDGQLCLWQQAKTRSLKLKGAVSGFSCLVWHPQGHQLAAGGQEGELGIWSQELRGQGFGRR